MRRAAAILALLLVSAAAGAEPYRDGDNRFEVELRGDWARDGDALTWRNADTGQALVVTRIDGPTLDAWRGKRAFFAAVEKGVRDASPEFRLLKKRRGKEGRVPRMDLWFEYRAADGERVTVAMRFLFFRSYALSLAIDTPSKRFRKQRSKVRHMTKSFVPYFPAEPAP